MSFIPIDSNHWLEDKWDKESRAELKRSELCLCHMLDFGEITYVFGFIFLICKAPLTELGSADQELESASTRAHSVEEGCVCGAWGHGWKIRGQYQRGKVRGVTHKWGRVPANIYWQPCEWSMDRVGLA